MGVFLVFAVDQLLHAILWLDQQIQGASSFVFAFVDEIDDCFGLICEEALLFDFFLDDSLDDRELIVGIDDDEIIA